MGEEAKEFPNVTFKHDGKTWSREIIQLVGHQSKHHNLHHGEMVLYQLNEAK